MTEFILETRGLFCHGWNTLTHIFFGHVDDCIDSREEQVTRSAILTPAPSINWNLKKSKIFF